MRSSERRTQLEKGFRYTYEVPLQKDLVEYLELKKDLLIKSMVVTNGEDLFSMKGELAVLLKLLTILKKPESQ